MTSYGTLSLSQLNVYDNDNTTISGNITYNNDNDIIVMNKGLDLYGNLTIKGADGVNGIIFPNGSKQLVAYTGIGDEVTTGGDNTFIGTNEFTSNFKVDNSLTNIGQLDNDNTGIITCQLLNKDGSLQKSFYTKNASYKEILSYNLFYDYFFRSSKKKRRKRKQIGYC